MNSSNLKKNRFTFLTTCLTLFAFLFVVNEVRGQTSTQNFGTSATTYSSGSTGSTSYIPNPTSGTTYARTSNAQGGAISLNTASNPLSTTDAYIKASAATGTSVVKFSPVVSYTSGTEFYTSFKVLFGDASAGSTATSGVWTFYQGNQGTNYTDNSDVATSQVFTGLRFTFGAAGALTLTYNNNGTYNSTSLTTSSFSQATVYTIEIVGNNKTSGTINYTYNGGAQTVAVQKFDLYINGTLVGNDLTKGTLAANTAINATSFTGVSSTSNVANLFVDDVVIYNAVPASIGATAPTVTSTAASSITTTTASSGGNVTADGGASVTARGVAYGTSATPTIAGTKTTDGTGTGSFTSSLTSLSVNTQYYYRAYATNSVGTSYGSETNFYTLANTPTTPTVNGATNSTLNVTLGASDGNPSATTYAIHETTTNQFVKADGSLGASADWQTLATWGTKTVTGLSAATSYTFEVKARNGAGSPVETSYSTTATLSTTSTLPEPTNQPTAFTKGTLTTSNIPLAWTAAVTGTQAPDGYYLQASSSGTPSQPTDAIDVANQTSISGGTANVKVTPQSASSYSSFTGFSAGTMYYFRINSYTNTSSAIDYLTSTAGPTVNFATLPNASTLLSFTATNFGGTTSTIGWTAASGYSNTNHSTLVFVKAGGTAITVGTPTAAPGTYTANTAFGSGTAYENDAAAYCVFNGDGTTVNLTGLTPNTTYQVLILNRVDVANSDGSYTYSASATTSGASAKTEPTAQPTSLVFSSQTTTSFNTAFTAAAGNPDGYIVIRSTSNTLSGNPVDGTTYSVGNSLGGGTVASVGATISGITNTSLSAGTTYYTYVFAYNNSSTLIDYYTTSPLTASTATLCAAPAPSASNVTSVSFDISWTAVTGATSYQLDVTTDAGYTTPVSGYNGITATSPTSVTGLAANTTYYFRVRAVNASGNSAYGTGSQLTSGLSAPTATAATSITSTSFTANWGAVTGASSYRLDVATSSLFGGNNTVSSDDFEGTLGNWSNTTDWVASSSTPITGSKSLKHNLSGVAGESYIYNQPTTYNLSNGTTTWQFNLKNGNFATSSNNKFTVFLASDITNISSSGSQNGYAVGLNMGGVTDNVISLFRIDNGTATRIITTTASAWAASTTYGIRVTRTAVGSWTVEYKSGGGFTSMTASSNVSDATYTTATYCGLDFTYTSTRAGLLFFDDFSIVQSVNTYVSGYQDLTVNGTTQSVTGLNAATNYYYRVRAFSTNSTSANSGTITVLTTADPNTADYRTVTSGNYSSASTWEYSNGDGTYTAASAAPTSGSNVTIQAAHSIVFDNNYSVGSGKTVTVNGTLNFGTNVLSGLGSLVVNNAGLIQVGSLNGSGAVNGNITASGGVTLNTGSTVEYNGAGAQTLAARTFGGLKINNASGVNLSGAVVVNATLTLTNGVLAVGTNSLTLNSTVTATSGSLSSAASGTVSYNQSTTGQTILAANYGNLTFSNFNKTLPSGTVGIAGTFTTGSATGHTITSNTINFNGSTQTVPAFSYNNLDLTGASSTSLVNGTINIAGTFTPASITSASTGTIVFNGTSAQTIPAFSYNSLTTSNSAGCTTSGNITVSSALTVSQNFVVANTHILTIGTSGSVSVASSKSLTINATGTLQNNTTTAFTLTGTLTVNGTYIHNANSSTIPGVSPASGVTYNAGSTINVGNGGSAVTSVLPTLPASIGGNVIWNTPSGSFSATAFFQTTPTTIGGNFTIIATGATLFHSSSTTLRTLNITGNLDIQGGTYHIATSGATVNPVTNVTGNVSVSGGTFLVSGNTTNSGTGTLNISGNLTHSGGTFGNAASSSTGTVNLVGTTARTIESIGQSGNVVFNVTQTTATGTTSVAASKSFVLSNASSFTINDNVSNATELTVNGTFKNSTTVTSTVITISSGALVNVANGGFYEHAKDGGTIPAFTYSTGSTINVTGITATMATLPTTIGGNVIWNSTSQSIGANFINTTPVSIGGDLTIISTGSGSITNGTASTARVLNITGNLNISGGIYSVLGNNAASTVTQTTNVTGNLTQTGGTVIIASGSASGNGILNIMGDVTVNNSTTTSTLNISSTSTGSGGALNVKGNFTHTAGTITKTGTTAATLTFNGTSASQTVSTTGLTNAIDVTLNNSNGVSLSSDITIGGVLTFTSGKITTGSNKVIISSTGSVSGGGTGWVIGNLQKSVSSTGALNFEIGGLSNYRPINLNFTSLTTPGTLVATVTQSDGNHASISTSGLDATKTIKRYWTLTNTSTVGTYDATFNFINPTDINGSANTNNLVIRKYSAGWTSTTIGTKTSTSSQCTGLTSFSDFAIGESETLIVTTQPSSTTVCHNSTNVTFTSSSSSTPTPSVQWQRDAGSGYVNIDGTTDGSIYSGYSSNTLTISTATNSLTGYLYRAVFTNINGTVNSNAATLFVGATGSWIGNIDNNWNNTSNWCGGSIPTSNTNVTITANSNNSYPSLTNNFSVSDLNLNGASTLSLAGYTLTIDGAVTGSGTITGSSTSNLTITNNAGSLKFTQTDATTRSLNNLNIGASGVAILGSALDVYNKIGFTAGGNLDMNSQAVRLVSDITKTARIDDLTGSVISNATNVTIERYIPANRKWRPVAVPLKGSSNNSIFYNWQNNGSVIANTGVELWKPSGTNGFTAAGASANILSYTGGNTGAGSGGYTQPTATNTAGSLFTSTGPVPYLLFATGPYGSPNITSGSDITTLKATGTLMQGNYSLTGLAEGYHLIANPYPSAITFTTSGNMTTTNIDDIIYVWDPKVGAGTGGYVTTNAGVSDNTSGSYSGNTRVIPNGSAFFVKVNAGGGGVINFTEACKASTGDFYIFGRGNANGQEIFRAAIKKPSANNIVTDAVAIIYNTNYNAAITPQDAEKFNSPSEGITLRRESKNFAIEQRPYITANDTIFLRLLNMQQNNYSLELKAEYFDANPGFEATLKDSYTNTSTPVSLTGTTNYNFTVDANTASTGDRFMIVFKPSTTLPVNITSIKATQKASTVMVDWTVENEVNLKEYQVQKSSDSRNFETLATVKANNNKAYSSIDNAPSQGANYYRVVSISNDDKKQYSNIVLVKFGVKNSEVAVYPNPIKGNTINLQLQNIDKGDYELQVINTVGQVLFRKPIQHNGGSATQTVQLSGNFAKGNYVLKLANKESILYSEKIILE